MASSARRPEYDGHRAGADSFRLIYYDQRGRGRSADGVRPADVSIGSEVEDLDRVRCHFGLESVALLGHSWGGVLAMEYATRHPDRVSNLILMNVAARIARAMPHGRLGELAGCGHFTYLDAPDEVHAHVTALPG